MQYTTLDHLKTFLGISGTDQDTELTALIEQATMLLDIEIGDNLGKKTVTRRVSGNESNRIIMENKINSVASIRYASGNGSIEVDYIDGNIVYLTKESERGQNNIEITYEKGYDTVPVDLERFFQQYCKELLALKDSSETEVVKSQSLGGGLSLTYFSPSELKGQLVDIDIILQKYKNFSVY